MTLTETKKLAKHICRLLKVQEITMPIGRTAKGNLGLVFNANNDEYAIMLDSVPLSTQNPLEDENNIELKKMIEKYMFTSENTVIFAKSSLDQMSADEAQKIVASVPQQESSHEQISHAKTPAKRGRPSKK